MWRYLIQLHTWSILTDKNFKKYTKQFAFFGRTSLSCWAKFDFYSGKLFARLFLWVSMMVCCKSVEKEILAANEIYIYKLLKFFFRSLNHGHQIVFLKSMFFFQKTVQLEPEIIITIYFFRFFLRWENLRDA